MTHKQTFDTVVDRLRRENESLHVLKTRLAKGTAQHARVYASNTKTETAVREQQQRVSALEGELLALIKG